jgi:hypothetical protein
MSVYFWGLLFLAVVLGVFFYLRLNYNRHIVRSEFCPKCGGSKFHRVRRRTVDRLLGFGLETRRFRCSNPNCKWEGMRQYYPHPKSWGKSTHHSHHSTES